MLDHAQNAALPLARPVRYGWSERIADWRDGGRDGRAGLPDSEVGAVTTPTVDALVYLFQGRAAEEYVLMTHDNMGRRARLVGLNKNIENGKRDLGQAERRLATVPHQLTEEQLAQRRGGESDTDLLTVQGRRRREHASMRDKLATKCADIQQQLDKDGVEHDRIQQEIIDREQQMVNEWARLYAYYSQRIMIYAKRLYRVHREGRYLQTHLRNLGQSELEGALRKLLELTDARYPGQSSGSRPEPVRHRKSAITPPRRSIGRRRSI
ncbi:MAG: hypothetical protein ACRDTF_19560 [Pseudonocardiaceae bacterium]